MNLEDTLCPACIIEHVKQKKMLGDEAFHYIVLKTPFSMCESHLKYPNTAYFEAGKILQDDMKRLESDIKQA